MPYFIPYLLIGANDKKSYFENKKIFTIPNRPKINFGLKNNLNDYIISKTLFSEKTHQII